MDGCFGWEVRTQGGSHTVRLWGELDMATAGQAERALVEAAGSRVDVDLAGLTFIDARGLNALLSARRRITRAGHTFAMEGASGAVRRVFEVTGLGSLLDD